MSKTKIDNLFLVNNFSPYFKVDNQLILPPGERTGETITTVRKVPDFWLDDSGSELIFFVIKNIYQDYEVIIVQKQNGRYQMLYPSEFNFDNNYTAVTVWTVKVPGKNLGQLSAKKVDQILILADDYRGNLIDDEFMDNLLG